MSNAFLKEPPSGLIPAKARDKELQAAIQAAAGGRLRIDIPFRPESSVATAARVDTSGGDWFDQERPSYWTLTIDGAEFSIDEAGCYRFKDATSGPRFLCAAGTAHVTEDGTIWRHLPYPGRPGIDLEKGSNASCRELPPSHTPPPSEEILAAFFEGAPWGWAEVGRLPSRPVLRPNGPSR